MYALDNDSGVQTMPEVKTKKFNHTEPRWFTEGGNGVAPSYPGADWFNIVQAELLNVLKDGGIQPEKSQLNQITTAIRQIVTNAVGIELNNKAPLKHQHVIADIIDLQTALDEAGKKGLPVGAIVAFPKEIEHPTGFLKCDGSEINQQTYPDLYRTLGEKTQVEGNKKRLPNLTRSDVGMTAYFATDKIPDGWIAFDEIKEKVKEDTYPELYKYLIEKYTRIDNVPKAEDRFLRNAHGELTVGMTQLGSLIGADSIDGNGAFSPYVKAIQSTYQETVDQVGFDPLLKEEIGNVRTAVNNESSQDGGQSETKKQYNAGLSWSVGTGKNEDLNDPIQNNNTGNGHFVGVTRPKSLVLKLCIKAKSSFDEVVFWIKAFGAVENQGVLDASAIVQDMRDFKGEMKAFVNNAFTQDLSENGWTKLPNGLIIQWGKLELSSVHQDKLCKFPIAFNQIFSLSEFSYYPNGSWYGNMAAGGTLKSYTPTEFTAQLHSCYTNNGGTPSYILWMAIGI